MTDEVEAAFRGSYGRAVATLVRVFGDISLAEDAVQDAFERALATWPRDGIPANPAGWIVATARNRATDVVRRNARGRVLTRQAAEDGDRLHGGAYEEEDEAAVLADDQLRLFFTCCHPAIRAEHQVALTLRLVAGLTPAEVARSFLVSEDTMAKRLVRAKYKIKAAYVPYRVPADTQLPARLQAVLTVLYLVYNAGADDPRNRSDLRGEAIRLVRELIALLPDEREAQGLLALLLLSEARAPSRWSPEGEPVLLQHQDRSAWDRTVIEEGQRLVLVGLRQPRPGAFVLQAAIQAVHCAATTYADTDWAAVLRFYDRLIHRTPTPVVALNRAIAVGQVAGAGAALAELDGLNRQLDGYHLLHATRAAFCERLGRSSDAAVAYGWAIALAPTEGEARLLRRRRAGLDGPGSTRQDGAP